MYKFLFFLILLVCDSVSSLTPSALAASSPNAQPVRAMHFVLRGVAVNDAKRMVDMAKTSGFNTLILSLADSVKVGSFPGKPLKDAWTADELLGVVKYARQQGLIVIPEIKLLTHQEKLFGQRRPDLMFNASTYDPRKSEVYEIVFPYLDEVITLLHPSVVLIGHDEAVGWKEEHFEKNLLKRGEQIVPPDLFLDDVNRLYGYLKRKGVETWVWGDMLISPDEFPTMKNSQLNGIARGYGSVLRHKLPKDIVICDWHYRDEQVEFPTLAAFRAEGFRVIGATWEKTKTIRNFSRYAAMHGADGMIATTWFYVQRKEWNMVERIIRDSGGVFSKDFPDAK